MAAAATHSAKLMPGRLGGYSSPGDLNFVSVFDDSITASLWKCAARTRLVLRIAAARYLAWRAAARNSAWRYAFRWTAQRIVPAERTRGPWPLRRRLWIRWWGGPVSWGIRKARAAAIQSLPVAAWRAVSHGWTRPTVSIVACWDSSSADSNGFFGKPVCLWRGPLSGSGKVPVDNRDAVWDAPSTCVSHATGLASTTPKRQKADTMAKRPARGILNWVTKVTRAPFLFAIRG